MARDERCAAGESRVAPTAHWVEHSIGVRRCVHAGSLLRTSNALYLVVAPTARTCTCTCTCNMCICMYATDTDRLLSDNIERETNEKRNLAYEGLLRARWPCQSANISLYLSPGQAQGRRRRWQPERCEREDSRRGAGNSLFERYWALLTARRSFCEGGWASPMAGVRRRWGSSRAEGGRRHRRIPPSTELQLSLCLSCAASR